MADTELVLTGIGIPDFSARGLSENMRPVRGPAPWVPVLVARA